jgi:hypothetical protein
MNEKFRIIRLRENPVRKKKGGGRKRRQPTAAPRRATSSRRRRKYAASRRPRAFLVEGLLERGGRIGFVYWNGRQFVAKKSAAKIFRTEKEANKACHASMKRRPAAYRLARVVLA